MVRVLVVLLCLHVGIFASSFEKQLKLAKDGKAHSMAYVGSNYYEGKIVKQDYNKAFRWLYLGASSGSNTAKNWLSRMYYEGKGVEKNYLAAYKWAFLSKKSGSKEGAGLVKFLKPKVDYYKKRRFKKLDETPARKKAFGLILGDSFPDELVNTNYDGYVYGGNIKYSHDKIKIDYAKKSDRVFERVSVKLSPISHTLYRLRAVHYFDDDEGCISFMRGYLQDLGGGRTKKATDKYGEPFEYIDFGVINSPTLKNNFCDIDNMENLQGIRHKITCSGSVGKIEVIDFPAKELAIAEAVEKEPFFGEYFGKEIEVKADYMRPFGLSLLKPFRGDSKNGIKPPKPSSMFSSYHVKTSSLTDTLYGVTAVGKFKDEGRCKVAIGSVIGKFIDSYKAKDYINNQYWYKIYGGVESTFFINENGVVQNPDDGIKTTKELLKVRMGCENPNGDGWKGWMNIYSEYARDIAVFEEKLLVEDLW